MAPSFTKVAVAASWQFDVVNRTGRRYSHRSRPEPRSPFCNGLGESRMSAVRWQVNCVPSIAKQPMLSRVHLDVIAWLIDDRLRRSGIAWADRSVLMHASEVSGGSLSAFA